MSATPTTTPNPPYDLCVCMGRFQPFHRGHLDLVQATLRQGRWGLVLLGSHDKDGTPRNPWTSDQRWQMIQSSLTAVERARLAWVPVADHPSHGVWAEGIRQVVSERAGAISGSPPKVNSGANPTIALIGHHPEGAAFFARWFPQWPYLPWPRRPHLCATAIRAAYFGGQTEATYAPHLPPGTLAYLRTFKADSRYARLAAEGDWAPREPPMPDS